MRPIRLAALTLAVLAVPGAAQAQRVVADISIHQGPIAGRVIIGDRYHPRPDYREYAVVRQYHGGGWYRSNGYHPMRMYWDGYRYYDRPYRSGLNLVWVYERGGHYYHDAPRNDYRRRVERHDRYDDRRNDYRDDRRDHRADRRDDRRDNRRDDRHDDRNDARGRNGHR